MVQGEKIIGIDLGTTNSVVAVMEGKESKVIPNQEGNRLTPSVVAFTDKGDVLVGELARRQSITNPKRTVYSIKRFMGRRHNEVASEEKIVPYEVVGGADDYVKVRVGDKQYTPAEVSAMILRPPTSTMPSAKPLRTPAKLPDSKSPASSTSRPPPLWRMVWRERNMKRSSCSTSAAARSMFPSSKWPRECSASLAPTAIRTSAATISTTS
jgi:hypothetical protein